MNEKKLKSELIVLRDKMSDDYYGDKKEFFDWENVADLLHDTLITLINNLEGIEEK